MQLVFFSSKHLHAELKYYLGIHNIQSKTMVPYTFSRESIASRIIPNNAQGRMYGPKGSEKIVFLGFKAPIIENRNTFILCETMSAEVKLLSTCVYMYLLM